MQELDKTQAEQVTGALITKRPPITTLAIGEEGPIATTLAIGEEGPIATTLALGEEGGGIKHAPEGAGALGSF